MCSHGFVTFEKIEFPAADEAVQWMRNHAVPAARGLTGFRAATVVVDREGGTMMVATFFDRLASVKAAEPAFARTADRIPGELRAAVEGWVTSAKIFEVPLVEGFGSQATP